MPERYVDKNQAKKARKLAAKIEAYDDQSTGWVAGEQKPSSLP